MTVRQLSASPRSDSRPPCWNRPSCTTPLDPTVRTSQLGRQINVHVCSDWTSDRCTLWGPVGAGPATSRHPHGTPLPVMLAFRCVGCRWIPAAHMADALSATTEPLLEIRPHG